MLVHNEHNYLLVHWVSTSCFNFVFLGEHWSSLITFDHYCCDFGYCHIWICYDYDPTLINIFVCLIFLNAKFGIVFTVTPPQWTHRLIHNRPQVNTHNVGVQCHPSLVCIHMHWIAYLLYVQCSHVYVYISVYIYIHKPSTISIISICTRCYVYIYTIEYNVSYIQVY